MLNLIHSTDYCINELLANDVLLVSKTLLGYEQAIWPKNMEIRHASQILTNDNQILVLSYLLNYYRTYLTIESNYKQIRI